MTTLMFHGTAIHDRDGVPVRVVDRDGAVQLTFAWAGDALAALTVHGAPEVTVGGPAIAHPLLGRAHVIEVHGTPITAMSAIDWMRPTELPTIAAPGELPRGAGGMILNAIAIAAQFAGVSALRYAGPYPTSALWHTLLRSFRSAGTEAEFTADVVGRAMRLARDPIPIDLHPAPFERVTTGADHAELRGDVQRALLAGVIYEGDPAVRGAPAGAWAPARLVAIDRGYAAELWFGDGPYARVATLAADGTVRDGPHPIPASTSAVIGKTFPDNLRAALAELIADAVPPLLAHDARAFVEHAQIRWADLGARAAHATADGFEVHAALWDRIAPLGLARVALALAEALAPIVTAALLERVAAARAPAGI